MAADEECVLPGRTFLGEPPNVMGFICEPPLSHNSGLKRLHQYRCT